MEEFETFYDDIKEIGGSLKVTIPADLAKYAGYKIGDRVKLMIKKQEVKGE